MKVIMLEEKDPNEELAKILEALPTDQRDMRFKVLLNALELTAQKDVTSTIIDWRERVRIAAAKLAKLQYNIR